MIYRGYTITAEVEVYDHYEIDDDGRPCERLGDGDGFTVTGYFFTDEDDQTEFIQMGETTGDHLRQTVDYLIKEQEAK